ncbi:MAG: hypothetical protein K8S13_17090 [Desulfobacula sp.]|uniref:hypothetical protein n=1 Tax=Desulfobacula sp. TaxID=2593537 RepID=UPI0025BB6973|nr:hypothetical protein [Desulfobacula sp.]MCD4721556.1 hypothetical protein [Desulfobacula sp.]
MVFLAGQYKTQGKSDNIVKNNKTYPFICKFFKDGLVDNQAALLALQQLAEYISEGEFNTIMLTTGQPAALFPSADQEFLLTMEKVSFVCYARYGRDCSLSYLFSCFKLSAVIGVNKALSSLFCFGTVNYLSLPCE